MNEISRALTKSLMLEILAECDQSFSDVLIKRVHPIVKQLVENEFEAQKNKLVFEISVMVGQMIGSYDRPLWTSTPKSLGLQEEDLAQEFGKKKHDA